MVGDWNFLPINCFDSALGNRVKGGTQNCIVILQNNYKAQSGIGKYPLHFLLGRYVWCLWGNPFPPLQMQELRKYMSGYGAQKKYCLFWKASFSLLLILFIQHLCDDKFSSFVDFAEGAAKPV